MKKHLLLSVAVFSLIAAQANAQEREFTFTVTASDVSTFDKALRKQPYEEVVALMNKLQAQIAAQLKPVPTPEQKVEPKKE